MINMYTTYNVVVVVVVAPLLPTVIEEGGDYISIFNLMWFLT